MGAIPWITVWVVAMAGSSPLQPAVLVVNEPRAGSMGASDIHSYQVSLVASGAYVLNLEQRGLDFVVSLEQPNGTTDDFNSPMLRQESERLLIEPATTGVYTIRLTCDEYTGASGDYTIEISQLRLSNREERLRRAALAHETRAASRYHQGGKNTWREVVTAYRDAITTWQDVGDRTAEARAHFALARVLYNELTDWTASLREARTAAGLYRQADRRSLYASARHLEAAAIIEEATQIHHSGSTADAAVAMFDEARNVFLEAANTKRELGEEYEYGRIVNDIGLSYYYQGAWQEARRYFADAEVTFQAADEWADELKATMNLGVVSQEEGHLAKAVDSYTKALKLIPTGKLSDLRGIILDNLSTAYLALGKFDEALESALQALELHEARGELKAQSQSLGDIGVTYYLAGDLTLAAEYLERALEMRRRANDGRGQVAALRFLGSIYLERNDVDRAVTAHREAMSLAASGADRAQVATLLGRDLESAGERSAALAILTQGIADARESTNAAILASILHERGTVLLAEGKLNDAKLDFETALKQFEELGMLPHAARAHFDLARLSKASAQMDEALHQSLLAIDLVERQRGRITNPNFRASFLGSHRTYYELYIDLQMTRYFASNDTRFLKAALETSERARARTLSELLTEAHAEVRKGIDASLRHRETALLQELAELRFQHEGMLMAAGSSIDEIRDLMERMLHVEAELTAVETRFRRESPGYAELTTSESFDLSEIQQSLEPDTLLIEYALGNPRSFVFAVTRDSLSGFPLPSGDAIEALAHETHDNLSSRGQERAGRGQTRVLSEISAAVLQPLRPMLTHRRIIVVADGALHYVPFAALPEESNGGEPAPLLMSHEIVNIPSMSLLGAQRRHARSRSKPARTVAIFADPVFSREDPRFAGLDRDDRDVDAVRIEALQTSVTHSDSLPRLPATGSEAAVISALVQENERFVATGFAASRDVLLASRLRDYRIVHIATHGLIDSRYPALSALALSFFGPQGNPIDGWIRLSDIFNMELNADLVVLSACDAALGQEIRGEGLIGLTRGFLYAGAATVVASLWQVPDRATAALMEIFYEAQLSNEKTPAAALREAQLSIARQPRWRDPYYWSSFTVQGEWQLYD